MTSAQQVLPSNPVEASGLLGTGTKPPPRSLLLETLSGTPVKPAAKTIVDTYGAYMGEGFPPVLASKVRQGDFIEMGELLSEFWSTPREEEDTPRTEGEGADPA